ncbi:MAG: hypothetical protein H6708_24425 [Kofleriaceae bacterium]|nr:hypothetical protein [Kofleriaceae bacterium]
MHRMAGTGLVCALGLLAGVAGCGNDNSSPFDAARYDAEIPRGGLGLTWTIADGTVAKTCAEVGALTVTLTIVPNDQPFGTTDVLSCGPGMGEVGNLAPGLYDVTATLAGAAGDLGEPVRFLDVEVAASQTTALGEAAFDVPAQGGFTFKLSAGGMPTCTTAGITGVQLELRDGAGCVPAAFDIAAGAVEPAGTYTTDCTTPAPYACIAEDQVVSTAGLATGSYTMTITGFVGADACWSRSPQFGVPAGDHVTQLPTQNLTLDSGNPACVP